MKYGEIIWARGERLFLSLNSLWSAATSRNLFFTVSMSLLRCWFRLCQREIFINSRAQRINFNSLTLLKWITIKIRIIVDKKEVWYSRFESKTFFLSFFDFPVKWSRFLVCAGWANSKLFVWKIKFQPFHVNCSLTLERSPFLGLSINSRLRRHTRYT